MLSFEWQKRAYAGLTITYAITYVLKFTLQDINGNFNDINLTVTDCIGAENPAEYTSPE